MDAALVRQSLPGPHILRPMHSRMAAAAGAVDRKTSISGMYSQPFRAMYKWLCSGLLLPSFCFCMPSSASLSANITPSSVLDFWFSENMSKRWFSGGPELDEEIRSKFGRLVELAQSGGLAEWETEPQSRLALVIVLDQFSRNIFRGKAKAFAGDARAQQLVTDALAHGFAEQLPWMGRVFLYMPLMHAENLALQEESVRRFTALAEAVPEALRASVRSSLDFAIQHRDIIARLGRFPYRNAALSRTNTALEFDFLKIGPRFGQ